MRLLHMRPDHIIPGHANRTRPTVIRERKAQKVRSSAPVGLTPILWKLEVKKIGEVPRL